MALPIRMPLNLPKWLSENSHLLKPPINNYCVYNDDMTVMVGGAPANFGRCGCLPEQIVGGPNARSDFHINTTPEFFYQYKGPMLLRIVDQAVDAPYRDIPIREGELFLLPPNTPHNPIRFADTVGVVLEQPRPENSVDTLRWYCQACHNIVHEASFHCTDLGTQIKEAVNEFVADEKRRTCGACGTLCESVPSNVTQP